jgi:phosphoserine phosphatase RsbU/P
MFSEIDQAPCLYFTCDDQGSILRVNETLENTLQFQRTQLIGSHLNIIFPVSTRIFYNTHIFPLLTVNGRVDEVFIHLQTSTGEHVPMLVNAIRTSEMPAVNKFVAMKVENRNKYETELITARNEALKTASENIELKAAQRSSQEKSLKLDMALTSLKKQLEELKQLNKIVTHDLQEPMRKLLFYTGLLKQKVKEVDPLKTVTKMEASSLQLKKVLTALQEYIWLDDHELKMETIDLDKVVEQARMKVTEELDNDKMQWRIDHLPSFVGDESLVFNIFYHLFKNAVQYSRKGQKNIVTVYSTTVTENAFKQTDDNYDFIQYYRITIQDQGVGFPADDKEINEGIQLFRKWNKDEGLGMGLAMSRKMVDLHRGRLVITSSRETGTRIHIYWRTQLK